MGEAKVEVLSPDGRVERTLPIRINGSDPTFHLATERIEANALRPVDDLLLDLLDVAGVVFAADSSFSRGRDGSDFGERWRRNFHMTIKVRRPEIWQRREVVDALVDVTSFLTEDRFEFVFESSPREVSPQEYLDFQGQDQAPFQIDEVILFSGGLDSLAGAIETLQAKKRVALVTHRSAPKVVPMQTQLGQALRDKFPGQVLHIPVKATKAGKQTADRSQRSRSFLFAALGCVAARMLGARGISFYENGIISHNLPVNGQVVGTMATRTTHPLGLRKLDRFLSVLDAAHVPISNPYSWLTKTDVVKRLALYDATHLIKEAVSCTVMVARENDQPHCGACSQCLDRRFAMLAAGLAEHDPADGYVTDVLFGERSEERSQTMALDWTRHAIALADLASMEFATSYASELVRIASGHPELAPVETVTRAHDLHVRHGQTVRQVLEQTLVTHASAIVRGRLPTTSLFRTYVAQTSSTAALPSVIPPQSIPPAAIEASPTRPDEPLLPLQVAFRAKGRRRVVQVLGLTTLTGRQADVAHALKPMFDEDRARGVRRENARFMRAWDLADELGTNDAAARKYVSRCRGELSEAYATVAGEPPPADLLIQSRKLQGFRLDPDCRVIDPDES